MGPVSRVIHLALHCSWELPQTLLGALVFTYVRALDRAASTVNGPLATLVTHTVRIRGGISLGMFIVTSDYHRMFRTVPAGVQQRLDAHELGHVKQSLMLGPLYLPLVGLPSVSRAALLRFSRRCGGAFSARWGHTRWYYSGYPEHWANRLAGIDRSDRKSSAGRGGVRRGGPTRARGSRRR